MECARASRFAIVWSEADPGQGLALCMACQDDVFGVQTAMSKEGYSCVLAKDLGPGSGIADHECHLPQLEHDHERLGQSLCSL